MKITFLATIFTAICLLLTTTVFASTPFTFPSVSFCRLFWPLGDVLSSFDTFWPKNLTLSLADHKPLKLLLLLRKAQPPPPPRSPHFSRARAEMENKGKKMVNNSSDPESGGRICRVAQKLVPLLLAK